ncbi:MAG: hypothetical protein GXY05_16355 [Clostridiales bacterium]|nr:hypothetical protein [Clostridiales bacterium]
MKSKDLFEAIGGADEELVERCRQNKTHRPLWLKWGALAACLCLVVVGVLTIPGVLPLEQPAPPYSQDQTEAPRPDVAVPIINGSSYEGSAGSYVIPEPGTTLFFVEVRKAIEEWRGSSALLFLAVNINDISEEILDDDSEEMRVEAERLASLGYEIGWYEAWTYQGQGEKVPYTFLYALLSVDELESFSASPDYGYSFYFPHNGDGSAVEYTAVGKIINAQAAGESEGTGLAPTELTEAEAYAAIGAYLPESAPDGFVFESAYLSDGAVSITWTMGYSELRWTVSDMTEADAERQTPAANTENYDLSLYPVPRAESVPDYRREMVTDPVFLSYELTQEVVDMRTDYSDEPGDEGVRLRFGVHYSDNKMLVEISSKGVSPEWAYEKLMELEN